ncbi:DegT/DnrJ/EryC1/StrS aminotransferase family protein, partial [Candidatus Saccharibacteria bacterium]|nr:DegT/DnrJ/EryC1/StrS aminotransferase family protein [Candidatus Saccharibacteria bacterium]
MKLESLLDGRYDGSVYLFYKGREALRQAMLAADLKKGSAVAINGFTCFVVDEAVTEAGLKSEYLDIDKDQLHFTAKTLEKAVKSNPKIKAVIIQNTLGYPCDIVGIEAICKKNGLLLIEDLAHSFGLVY